MIDRAVRGQRNDQFTAKIRMPDFPKRAVGLFCPTAVFRRLSAFVIAPKRPMRTSLGSLPDWDDAEPASREAFRRAAVISRPSRMSREHPRALRARSGVQGHCPWGVAHETADGYVAADDHP